MLEKKIHLEFLVFWFGGSNFSPAVPVSSKWEKKSSCSGIRRELREEFLCPNKGGTAKTSQVSNGRNQKKTRKWKKKKNWWEWVPRVHPFFPSGQISFRDLLRSRTKGSWMWLQVEMNRYQSVAPTYRGVRSLCSGWIRWKVIAFDGDGILVWRRSKQIRLSTSRCW